MKRIFWLRKTHKWLALIAGIQILIWSISGLYMTAVDLDIIHGDHLVKEFKPNTLESDKISPISLQIIEQLAPIQSIRLKIYFKQAVYEIRSAKQLTIVNAFTGEIKANLTAKVIEQQTKEIYAGEAGISSIELLPAYPGEIGGRKLPIWQVQYDDWLQSTLYFHVQSGRLISKRTDLWRAFDFLWLLHIMEYQGVGGITGIIFRVFSIASMLMALFGSWLLFYRLKGEHQ
jgi:uncharacterized iron-regulated membrane protein